MSYALTGSRSWFFRAFRSAQLSSLFAEPPPRKCFPGTSARHRPLRWRTGHFVFLLMLDLDVTVAIVPSSSSSPLSWSLGLPLVVLRPWLQSCCPPRHQCPLWLRSHSPLHRRQYSSLLLMSLRPASPPAPAHPSFLCCRLLVVAVCNLKSQHPYSNIKMKNAKQMQNGSFAYGLCYLKY